MIRLPQDWKNIISLGKVVTAPSHFGHDGFFVMHANPWKLVFFPLSSPFFLLLFVCRIIEHTHTHTQALCLDPLMSYLVDTHGCV